MEYFVVNLKSDILYDTNTLFYIRSGLYLARETTNNWLELFVSDSEEWFEVTLTLFDNEFIEVRYVY